MKILWVSSRVIGPSEKLYANDYNGVSGSWIQTEYDSLNKKNIRIDFLCGIKNGQSRTIIHKTSEESDFYGVHLPRISNGYTLPKAQKTQISNILRVVNPDIIHVWGTESSLQASVIECAKGIPTVIFVQGLIGMHLRYQGGYLLQHHPSYRQYISLKEKILRKVKNHAFSKQVSLEKKMICSSKNIITDNAFTRAYCRSFVSDVHYFHKEIGVNEVFRKKKWELSDCTTNRIFTIFGGNPDKGIHQLFYAINLIKNDFPNLEVFVPGPFNANEDGELIISRSSSSYEKWLFTQIKNMDLTNYVRFVGRKSPSQMAAILLSSNVFVNPSCMEVHALSLREAMTMGVPSVSALSGSILEFVHHEITGLVYRYEEYEVLAMHLSKMLSCSSYAAELGNKAREMMESRVLHPENMPLEKIYSSILFDEQKNEK